MSEEKVAVADIRALEASRLRASGTATLNGHPFRWEAYRKAPTKAEVLIFISGRWSQGDLTAACAEISPVALGAMQ